MKVQITGVDVYVRHSFEMVRTVDDLTEAKELFLLVKETLGDVFKNLTLTVLEE